MSFNVLIITEDFRKDEHVIGPVVKKIFQHLDKKARVEVCRNPRFQGFSQCKNVDTLKEKVVKAYPMVNLFLLLVDRDADEDRRQSLTDIEDRLQEHLKPHQAFLAEHAFQEVEVWALAGHDDLPAEWSWRDIRAERDPKERYFLPFSETKGFSKFPHQGRKQLTELSLKNWSRILQLCPEDIGRLIERIQPIIQ